MIYDADFVIVLDPTLLTEERTSEIYKSLKPDRVVIINSPVKIKKSNTYTVNASRIAEAYLGKRDMVNIAMLGALKKVLDKKYEFPKIPWEYFEKAIKETFERKNPAIIDKNIAAMKKVYKAMKI